jgi:hypothetical protein
MKYAAALFAILLFVLPGQAWNATGHKAIALIAYSRLTPKVRATVDQLLSRHPDYRSWVAAVAPQDRGRVAFLEASIWPDTIKSDGRFHNDNARPTPNIPGLPPEAQMPTQFKRERLHMTVPHLRVIDWRTSSICS